MSLSASLGTLYSDANRRLVYDSLGAIPTPQDYPFEDQFNDNVSQAISLSLSIPIFNNWQVNSSINRAKVAVLQAQYSLQEAKNNLRKIIEQAHNPTRGLEDFPENPKSVQRSIKDGQ